MRGPGPVTILPLCCASEREQREQPGSAPVTQLLVALVLSLESTPRPAADPSPLSLICPVECLQPGLFNQNQLQSSACLFFSIPKPLRLLFGYVTVSRLTVQLCTCYSVRDVLMFNPTLGDFILWLWLWRPDVRLCAHLKLHPERSGEMHSFASLATDVGKSIFPPFELNLLECLKTVRCGLQGSCFARGG